MHLADIVRFLDRHLAIRRIPDESRNGLQVRGSARVTSVAFAVDACMDTFLKAKKSRAELVIVHHGLFWKEEEPNELTERRAGFLRKNKISLYAAHLPLDMHREVGNNAAIAKILGLKNLKPFGRHDNLFIGFSGTLAKKMAREAFAKIIGEKIGRVRAVHFFGKKSVSKIGIVSGGGSFAVGEMNNSGLDTLVSGEPRHKDYHATLEARVNAIYAGHYDTERFGVIEMSKRLKKEFPELGIRFIDSPTGL